VGYDSLEKFKFIDLFAGIGGMRLAFESVGGNCVYTSEWNKFSEETYRANFDCTGEHKFDSDITKVNAEDIPEHDLLVAGFPCQPFSLAGVSKKKSLGRSHGFEDETQGTLFFDICRILKEKRPKAILLENVKNLVSHNKGHTMKVILDSLTNLGYNLGLDNKFFRIIDAKSFVPQHRERTFIVGLLDGSGDFSWSDFKVKDRKMTLASVLHPEDGTEGEEAPFTLGKKGKVNPKYTLSDKLWNYLYEYKKKHEAKGNGFGYGLVDRDMTSRTLSARYHKDGSEILVKQKGMNPRRLTPRECARLMGFDQVYQETYGENFCIPVSDTQSYRQFGNAVVVPVVKEIAKFMLPNLISDKRLQVA
jgi:DNA (cytosine-5)-methyltransferase 1